MRPEPRWAFRACDARAASPRRAVGTLSALPPTSPSPPRPHTSRPMGPQSPLADSSCNGEGSIHSSVWETDCTWNLDLVTTSFNVAR